MNLVRTDIRVDPERLLGDWRRKEACCDQRWVGITHNEAGQKYENYCFPGAMAHGLRFQGTKKLTLEQEREISNSAGAQYDHLFTERNLHCFGYVNNVLDFFVNARRGSWWTLDPGFSYKAHRDKPYDSFRAHIALTTNSYCYMAWDDGECHHIPVDGYVYLARTDVKHSAWNLGDCSRTHIMLKLPLTEWEYYADYPEHTI